jgi:hypothetical protein
MKELSTSNTHTVMRLQYEQQEWKVIDRATDPVLPHHKKDKKYFHKKQTQERKRE